MLDSSGCEVTLISFPTPSRRKKSSCKQRYQKLSILVMRHCGWGRKWPFFHLHKCFLSAGLRTAASTLSMCTQCKYSRNKRSILEGWRCLSKKSKYPKVFFRSLLGKRGSSRSRPVNSPPAQKHQCNLVGLHLQVSTSTVGWQLCRFTPQTSPEFKAGGIDKDVLGNPLIPPETGRRIPNEPVIAYALSSKSSCSYTLV